MKRHFIKWHNIVLGKILGVHPYNTIFNYNWTIIRPIVQTLEDNKHIFSGKVVDLGAGRSPYYNIIEKNSTMYISLDYPNQFSKNDERDIIMVAGSIEKIPLSDRSVNAVLCTQALLYVADPRSAIHEIFRILDYGGYAFLSVPHISPINGEPYDYYRFTPDGLQQLANTAGFNITQIHTQGKLFGSFALCFAMNLILSPIKQKESMYIITRRQLIFAPLIAAVNLLAYILDKLLPFTRTPTNIIIIIQKPYKSI